jgi:hypothetical protein
MALILLGTSTPVFAGRIAGDRGPQAPLTWRYQSPSPRPASDPQAGLDNALLSMPVPRFSTLQFILALLESYWLGVPGQFAGW